MTVSTDVPNTDPEWQKHLDCVASLNTSLATANPGGKGRLCLCFWVKIIWISIFMQSNIARARGMAGSAGRTRCPDCQRSHRVPPSLPDSIQLVSVFETLPSQNT